MMGQVVSNSINNRRYNSTSFVLSLRAYMVNDFKCFGISVRVVILPTAHFSEEIA